MAIKRVIIIRIKRKRAVSITEHLKKHPLFYGWYLLALCVSNVSMANGVMYAFSVILVALLTDFGLSRAELSGIFSLYMFVFFSSGVVVGPLLDRLGPRKVIPLGAVLIGVGLTACSRISSPYQLYFTYGLLTSLGAGCVGWIPNSVVISKWFVRRRGMAVGVVMCGSGLGILIFVPLTQFVIELAGWRQGFLAIAFLAVIFVVPLNAIFQRARPEDKGLLPDGEKPETINDDRPKREPEHRIRFWTLSDALRHPSFWMMCVAFFCNPLATFSIVLHQVALIVERGFDPMYAASMVGLLGIFAVGGRFLGGTLSDYIGREKAYTLFMTCSVVGVSFLLLLDSRHSWMLPAYVVIMGMGMGVGGAMFPTMIADLFPGPNMGKILGICALFSGCGSGVGTWLVGYLHDIAGNYTWGLWCILAALLGAVATVWIAAPRKAHSPTR